MNPIYAFAHGALVKMAEHNVNPRSFVQAAVNTQDPGALKIARALVEYEKVAGNPTLAGALTGHGSQRLLDRVGGYADNLRGRLPNVMQDAMHNPFGEEGLIAIARGQHGAELSAPARRALALQGGSVAGGAGGLAYGLGDADTYGNQAANAANDYLGTDFDTQSRFSNMMG